MVREPQEITSIIVCGPAHEDLEGFIAEVRGSGSWGIVPIEWPNPATLVAARDAASAFVLVRPIVTSRHRPARAARHADAGSSR